MAQAGMRISVRKPDGGDLEIAIADDYTVAQLRHLLLWCLQHQEWDKHAIPRQVIEGAKFGQKKSKAGSKVTKAPDEMWTLSEPADELGAAGAAHDPDQEEEFEQANSRSAEAIYDAEKGVWIGMMYGMVVLQDGHQLKEYGVEDGSFIHPLWELKAEETHRWDSVVSSLPWTDREWYRSTARMTASYGQRMSDSWTPEWLNLSSIQSDGSTNHTNGTQNLNQAGNTETTQDTPALSEQKSYPSGLGQLSTFSWSNVVSFWGTHSTEAAESTKTGQTLQTSLNGNEAL